MYIYLTFKDTSDDQSSITSNQTNHYIIILFNIEYKKSHLFDKVKFIDNKIMFQNVLKCMAVA